MSDVLLLLADIRHPFFHFPVALYRAAVLEARKPLVLVLNKIDLGTAVRAESQYSSTNNSQSYFHQSFVQKLSGQEYLSGDMFGVMRKTV